MRLDRRLGRRVAGLGRQVLGDRALGVERAAGALAGVDPGRGLLQERARCLQPHRVRHDQLVGVALLARQRRAALNSVERVVDRAVQRAPAAAQAEGADHHPGVAEDLLGLGQAAALLAADEVVGRHHHVVEEQRRGVGQPDAVLVLRRRRREARGALLDDEPRRAGGRERQHGVGVGDRAVADPLLAPGDRVGRHPPVGGDRGGRRLHGAQVAAGFGLGGAVGEQDALLGDPAQPLLALLVGRADQDRIGAQEGGENRCGEPDVDARQAFTDPVGVEGPAAQPAVLLGDEHQLNTEVLAAHRADGLLGADVVVVEFEQPLVRQGRGDELLQRLQHHVEGVPVEPDGGAHVFSSGWWCWRAHPANLTVPPGVSRLT
ncbi:hypothetical protein BN971_04665 [Mycobacterium bohemicum DSM 44277]|uniref:Uncharacterized protein n=1 Tax=Mycobacterium bohemicum DSM 44277 TaxID=1236609 RepID=A0A0U0WGA5_MYCBE|nr:hypothetical protein BN971_04665 [Mycobacterium bohemicum DSM 44277]